MRISRKHILTSVVLVVILGAGVCGGWYAKDHYRNEILSSDVFQRLIPLYRSLRKLPDIVFMPWSAFAKSNLETYEITISPQNIERMNAVLPDEPFNSGMDEDSKLWVSGYFRAPGYEGNVDVRYRGNLSSHWNAYQKSYAIKFPKDHLFNGMRELNIVIPSKRRYFAMSLNDYRAEKLGLIHPDEKLVRMELNGAQMGVLLAFEGWSQEWIEKMPISSLSTIYGVDEGTSPYRDRWDSWNSDEPIDFTPLETLEEIVDHASDEEFKRLIPLLIDIEDWYNWDIMRILASGYHVSADTAFGANNLVIIFDRAEGRFKPVPYNTVIYTPSFREMVGNPGVIGVPTLLYQRILGIPEFRTRRDTVWHEYVENEKAADLQYLQDWQDTYNREFLLDNAKNDNHFMYLAKIKENVTSATEHFDDPFHIIETEYNPAVTVKEPLDVPEAFQYLAAAAATPAQAATQHPALTETTNGLYLPAGTHWFEKTIIIPANTHLTIAPGATLRFNTDASFISYSPITADATADRPITIDGYTADTHWGVFAVLNTGDATSTLRHVTASRGGETTINGAFISGTLAFHNSNVILDHVTVAEARGDDGINVKGAWTSITDTQLIENSSDGIDLDYVTPDSIIAHNTFTNNHGDALDISWSDIEIRENTIDTCADKGISVGESSKPTIIANHISHCQIGVAVKDSSLVHLYDNVIDSNATAVSAYQKKLFFGGGTALLANNTLTNNQQEFFTDHLSTITEE